MADASVSRPIAASPDVVWGLVSDVTRMGEWSPETTRGVWLKGVTGPAVGARFKGENELGKKSWSTTCEVVECEPGKSFCFRVLGGPFGVALWEYRIEPTDDGCVVTEDWTDDRGWLIRTAGKAMSGVAHDAEWTRNGMEQTLERLAAVAEAS